jgi:hypothetical protein
MAFVCTLHTDHLLAVTQISSEAGQGETIFRIPIGIDDETGLVFSAFVCLATVAGYGVTRHELVFYIVEANDEDEIFRQDGLETRTMISSRRDREQILSVICLATEKLIDQVAPVEVMIMTHEANLPLKALSKYGRIGSVFVGRGYVPAHPDPYHGRHIWMFTQP